MFSPGHVETFEDSLHEDVKYDVFMTLLNVDLPREDVDEAAMDQVSGAEPSETFNKGTHIMEVVLVIVTK